MELGKLTISSAHQGLVKKDFSAKELCKAFLSRIKQKDKQIQAFLTVTQDLALSQAKKVDQAIEKRKQIPVLAGMPLAIKDNILVKDVRCTAGSRILENYIAPYAASVIKKLKEQGAVILGKTNMDEFAMGSSGEHSAFFKTKNPYDLERVPGGSSSGSAAALSASMCVFALGSDTAGSIRQPASFCGLVGLKPTYGAVSRYGLIAMASSLDQIGPLSKTVKDAKIIFDAMSGKDEMDSTNVEMPRFKNRKLKVGDLRIGVPKEYFIDGMDPKVEKAVKSAIKKYEKAGAKIEQISLPHTEYSLAVYYIISPSEISANTARYDGIKFGYSKIFSHEDKASGLLDVYLESREQGFGDEVRRRIMLGTYVLSAGYYEAYYKRAQKVRTLIKQDFEKAFEKVDVILTPVSPTTAFKLGEKVENPLTMYLCDVFTAPVNLAGLPALAIPCGLADKLPVGFQIIGPAFSEQKLFQIGEIFEKMR